MHKSIESTLNYQKQNHNIFPVYGQLNSDSNNIQNETIEYV